MDKEKSLDKQFSEEQVDELIDFFEASNLCSPQRNDPCICGSGKKYKKCCLNKDVGIFPSLGVTLESFQIKTDPLTPEEDMNSFSLLSEEDKELLHTLYLRFQNQPETIDSENCDYFKQLDVLRIKYPNTPIVLNYIGNGYQLLNLDDKVKELVIETYEKFPGYLFGVTGRANIYIQEGSPEKAFEVLKGAYTLKQLYPHRDVFHYTEARAFLDCMVAYFCAIEEIKQAENYLQIMEDLLEEDDDLLQKAKVKFKKSKDRRKLQVGMSRLFGMVNKRQR